MYEFEEMTPLYTIVSKQKLGDKELYSVTIHRGSEKYADSSATEESAWAKVYNRMKAIREKRASMRPAHVVEETPGAYNLITKR